MIDNETLRKARLARDLLTEVRGDLTEYAETGYWRTSGPDDPRLPEIRNQVEEQQAAVRAVNRALDAMPESLALICAIWERLGKPEATPATLITWREGSHASWRGIAGGVEVASIHFHTHRDDPAYFTDSRLPGLQLDEKHDDLDVLKAAAEAAFSSWLARMGGAS